MPKAWAVVAVSENGLTRLGPDLIAMSIPSHWHDIGCQLLAGWLAALQLRSFNKIALIRSIIVRSLCIKLRKIAMRVTDASLGSSSRERAYKRAVHAIEHDLSSPSELTPRNGTQMPFCRGRVWL